MEKIPLVFAIAYNGLVAGRKGVKTNKRAVSYILAGETNPTDYTSFHDPEISKYINGSGDIESNLKADFGKQLEEEKRRRIELLQISNKQRTVFSFHAFLLEHLDLDNETIATLNNLVIKGQYTEYIIKIFELALQSPTNQKLVFAENDWLKESLHNLPVINRLEEIPMLDLVSYNGALNNSCRNEVYIKEETPTAKEQQPVFLVPAPSPWFTGREYELQAIQAAFFEEDREIVEITAPGGFGKTQLAKAYAEIYRDCYDAVYWVAAADLNGIAGQYANFLEIEGQKLKGLSEAVICHQFFENLNSHASWMIIFDDADFASGRYFSRFIETFLPKHQPNGKILITARSPRVMESAHAFSLSTMKNEPEAAASFLMERSGDHDEKAAADLAKRLSYHPLAMQLAASFVSAAHGFTLAGYLSELDSDISILNMVNEESDYEASLWQILQTTLRKIKESRNGDPSSDLAEAFLIMCSFCAANEVNPRAFCYFAPDATATIPEWAAEADKTDYYNEVKRLEKLAAYCQKEINQQDLISLLVRYGLLTKGEVPLLEILPPVQEMIRKSLGSNATLALMAVDFMDMQKAYGRESGEQIAIKSVYSNLSFLCHLVAESMGDGVSELQKLDIELLGATYRLRAEAERLYRICSDYDSREYAEELEMDLLRDVKKMTDFFLQRPMTGNSKYELQLLDYVLGSIFEFIRQENLNGKKRNIAALTEKAMAVANHTIDTVGYEQFFQFYTITRKENSSEKQSLLPERTMLKGMSDPLQEIVIYFIASLTDKGRVEKYDKAFDPILEAVENYIHTSIDMGYWTGADAEDGLKIIKAYREQNANLLPKSLNDPNLDAYVF